ncbi:hypothetical protein LCGC14_0427450 [marine sediment metagenome]|uniref:Uncharacterized protein n=1 Tax=marine sediment metagenome TaxID=412755 RepID=A0A0F9SNY2_9ZZZZ
MERAEEAFAEGDPRAAAHLAYRAEVEAQNLGMRKMVTSIVEARAWFALIHLNSWQCRSAVSTHAVKYRGKEAAMTAAEKVNETRKAVKAKASDRSKKAKKRAKDSAHEAETPGKDGKKGAPEKKAPKARSGKATKHGRIKFDVTKNGASVAISQQREGESKFSRVRTVAMKDIRASASKVAYGYTNDTIGSRKEVGNYGSTLYNALRKLV